MSPAIRVERTCRCNSIKFFPGGNILAEEYSRQTDRGILDPKQWLRPLVSKFTKVGGDFSCSVESTGSFLPVLGTYLTVLWRGC